MTFGMILDYIVTCQNEDVEAKEASKKENVRPATQADWDAF